MTINEFYSSLLPNNTLNKNIMYETTEKNKGLKIYNNSEKDVEFLKKVFYEKLENNGSPILYFALKTDNLPDMDFDNILKDETNLDFDEPIEMMAFFIPQEYQYDLNKFGITIPIGSDLQLFLHIDDTINKLKRKPKIGDVIETEWDRTRYRISDVHFGHNNLWENMFCMLMLTKVTYNNLTQKLDKYDEEYKDVYTKLEEVLNIDKTEIVNKSNEEIRKEKEETNSEFVPSVRGTNTELERFKSNDKSLDIMTMKL